MLILTYGGVQHIHARQMNGMSDTYYIYTHDTTDTQHRSAKADSIQPQKRKQRTISLIGQVKDSFTKVALKARITVMTADSSVVDTTSCSEWGREKQWYMNVPAKPGSLIIKCECQGYETGYINYTLRYIGRNAWLSMPDCLLKKKSDNDIYKDVDLQGVTVTGTKVKMTYRGDTIVYNASAFNLPEGSMLDALVKQMPGAELKSNGDIYINGKKIDYLTLNGKDFFKGKNKIMLDNMPYYTVKDLRVYNKSSEESQLLGRDVQKKDFVMDVNLKREYNRGYMGNAEVAGGTQERWMARMFGLYYDDRTRLSLFANANNVNENRTPGSEGDWAPANMPQGQTTTRQIGLTLDTGSKEGGLNENMDVTAEWTDALNDTRQASETFATDGNIFRRNISHDRQKDFRGTLDNRLTIKKKMDAGATLFTQLTYTDGHYTATGRNATFDSDPGTHGNIQEVIDSAFAAQANPVLNIVTNRSQSFTYNRYRTLTASHLTTAFSKLPWGDLLVASCTATYRQSKPNDSYSQHQNEYLKTEQTDTRNIFADKHNSSYSFAPKIRYNISLPSKWNIDIGSGYKQEWQSNNDLSYRLDRLGGRWAAIAQSMRHELPSTHDSLLMALDASNSSRYTLLKQTGIVEASINCGKDNSYLGIHLPLYFQREKLNYHQARLDTTATRRNTLFSPTLTYAIFNNKVQFWTSYNMTRTLPDMAAMMPVENDLNPLAIRISNPHLKAMLSNNLNSDITLMRKKHQQSLSFGMSFSHMRNSTGTRTTYNRATGAYTYMNDNVKDGNWNIGLRTGLARTLDKEGNLSVDQKLSYDYSRSTDFDISYDDADTRLSRVNTSVLAEHLSLRYQTGDLTIGTGGNLSWRNSTGNRDNFITLNTYDFDYGASLNYTVPCINVSIATDIRQYSRRGYGEPSMNTDYLVWNASLSRTLMKGHLVLKAQAFDLLHQLSSTTYSVNAQGRTEVWHNTIPSYGMISIAYKWSKMPRK